jgi:hypothetical protein
MPHSLSFVNSGVAMQQPSKHFAADSITAVANVYTCSYGGNSCDCKGAELAQGEADGVLKVHLIEDPDDVWYLLPLSAGSRGGCIFDKYHATGTTVTLSKVTIFPL